MELKKEMGLTQDREKVFFWSGSTENEGLSGTSGNYRDHPGMRGYPDHPGMRGYPEHPGMRPNEIMNEPPNRWEPGKHTKAFEKKKYSSLNEFEKKWNLSCLETSSIPKPKDSKLYELKEEGSDVLLFLKKVEGDEATLLANIKQIGTASYFEGIGQIYELVELDDRTNERQWILGHCYPFGRHV
jgi:hypothetical protein